MCRKLFDFDTSFKDNGIFQIFKISLQDLIFIQLYQRVPAIHQPFFEVPLDQNFIQNFVNLILILLVYPRLFVDTVRKKIAKFFQIFLNFLWKTVEVHVIVVGIS
jgi:hypothetical protein